jgi:lipoprotein NlpI
MLMYLDGRMDSTALLRLAGDKPESSALGLAEASFYIARRFAAQGRNDEARRWYARVLETKAVPYREFTFAGLELRGTR